MFTLKGFGLSSWQSFEANCSKCWQFCIQMFGNLATELQFAEVRYLRLQHICMFRHHLFFVIWLNRGKTRARAKLQDRVRATWNPLRGEKPQLKKALWREGVDDAVIEQLQDSSRDHVERHHAVLLSSSVVNEISFCFHMLSFCTWTVKFHLSHISVMLHSTTHTHIPTYLYIHQTENFIAIMQLSYLFAINFLLPIYTPWEQRSTSL